MSASNPYGRTRDIKQPYEIWQSADKISEWRVLKKDKNGMRWYCAVQTDATFGGWDFGDVLATDIMAQAYRTFIDPALSADPAASFRDPNFFTDVRPEPHGTRVTMPDPAQPRTQLYPETFPYLVDYFVARGGTSLHIPDATGTSWLFFLSESQDIETILDANWGMEYISESESALTLFLVIYDQPADPLKMPFFFNLTDPRHAYEAIQFIEQEDVSFCFLSREGDELSFVVERKLVAPDNMKQDFATAVRDILRRIKRLV